MIHWGKSSAKLQRDLEEREKMARLEAAERERDALLARGARAVTTLTARNDRNHWRESVRDMILGA